MSNFIIIITGGTGAYSGMGPRGGGSKLFYFLGGSATAGAQKPMETITFTVLGGRD